MPSWPLAMSEEDLSIIPWSLEGPGLVFHHIKGMRVYICFCKASSLLEQLYVHFFSL